MKRSATGAALAAALFAATLSSAHEGDNELRLELIRGLPQRLEVAADQSFATAAAIVEAATRTDGHRGEPVLPPGSITDQVEWDADNVLNVRITLPADAEPLSQHDVESLSSALQSPFLADPGFGGVRILVRRGADKIYAAVDDFSLGALDYTPTRFEPLESFEYVPADVEVTPLTPEISGLVAPQPTGALSGVTVYMSAGHGWTALASSWGLQRPLLLGMNEDYGNIDQLNYFAEFCRNAGATVVPLRPVGWQPIEVTLDQDDPGVTYTGAWSDSANPVYYENGVTLSGVAYRFASSAGAESATARYTPNLPSDGFYPVFTFVVSSTNRVPQKYRIAHSGGVSEMTVDHREVGNGWVWLGNYHFETSGPAWVEISNESPVAGVVIADGIRFGDGVGDLVRPGPGTISGFPRDEEAQRYWAQSELGENAVGFSSTIWGTGGSDLDTNVGAGARLAREMNQVPAGGVQVNRWKRVHLEFHTNAFDGNARGQICLINSSNPTTNQAAFAQILSDEVDADMLLLNGQFEHNWVDRISPTLSGAYGAISTNNNSNEFDATLVELAFHDNAADAQLLRDPKVRIAMARACTHGIIRFLNTLSGSQVPLAFAPDVPRRVRAEDLGGGDVRIAWIAPLSDGARGDPATGYIIEQSSNGLGFGDPITVGNVNSLIISGVPIGETRYYRVRATNAGGQSPPTKVMAVRRPNSGTADILIVNGYNRLDRFINVTQSLPGGTIERQIADRVNAYNYVIQHAEALAAMDEGFSSASNDAIINDDVLLANYAIAVWFLGQESTTEVSLTLGEQNKLTSFLTSGGALFLTGSDVAFDLINQGNGVTFAQNTLRIGYQADHANTFNVTPAGGGIFAGLANFNFNPASGAPYRVIAPDVLTAASGAQAALNYSGGTGGVAGVQFTGAVYNAVVFGFPFETISSATARADVMERVIDFLLSATGPIRFDVNGDGDVDFQDFQVFAFCWQGPDNTYSPGAFCLQMDADDDLDVDLHDFSQFQLEFTGPNP